MATGCSRGRGAARSAPGRGRRAGPPGLGGGRLPALQERRPDARGGGLGRGRRAGFARVGTQVEPLLLDQPLRLAVVGQDHLASSGAVAEEELAGVGQGVVGLAVGLAVFQRFQSCGRAGWAGGGGRPSRGWSGRGPGGSPGRARGGPRDAGAAKDKGDPELLLVERPLVLPGAVLQELLAVVGGQDDEGALVEADSARRSRTRPTWPSA